MWFALSSPPWNHGSTSLVARSDRQRHSEGCWKRLGLAVEGSTKIAEATRTENEFLARTLQAQATAGDAKWQRIEEDMAEIIPPTDGDAARGSGDQPPRDHSEQRPDETAKRMGGRHGR